MRWTLAVLAMAAVPGCHSHHDHDDHDHNLINIEILGSSGGGCARSGHETAAHQGAGDGPTLVYPNGHPLDWLTSDPQVLAAEEEMLALVNGARAAQGLPALAMDETMRRCARGHSRHMSAESHGFFAHVNPEGDGPGERLCANGMPGGAAENLARGSASAGEVVDAWLASPGHYANVMNPAHVRTGVGCQGAVWTQLFRDP